MARFIDIVNTGLIEINETEISEGNFLSPRGIQKSAKSFANRAYADIAGEAIEWPWLQSEVTRVEGTEVLTLGAGIQWYAMDAGDLEVDWNNFYITDKDPDVVSLADPLVSETLEYITYDQWAREFRAEDNKRTLEARATPEFVVRHPDGKMGFSPVPDKTYYSEYLVWKSSSNLVAATDVFNFPEEFESVLVSKVTYYLWKFRENNEQAEMSRRDYEDGIKRMKIALISNKTEKMRSV
tara:strand:+ start:6029 stop:6745 length:717 start_codon:yes stop_codon:yes gene_type:complete